MRFGGILGGFGVLVLSELAIRTTAWLEYTHCRSSFWARGSTVCTSLRATQQMSEMVQVAAVFGALELGTRDLRALMKI